MARIKGAMATRKRRKKVLKAAAGQQAKGADGACCGRRLAFFLYGRR